MLVQAGCPGGSNSPVSRLTYLVGRIPAERQLHETLTSRAVSAIVSIPKYWTLGGLRHRSLRVMTQSSSKILAQFGNGRSA
jgi:hypothetical protein